ncbi:defensin-2-like [Hylaeus anthracinus]|uniref:defensin-2-like n=1 Tax=Hylaeus anthracinus TaxID=313031 RepID=UPI0023B895F8|nr:defensin-2-like [Hylaeus anthracinus]
MKLFVVLCVFVAIACASVSSAPQAVYDGPIYELTPIESSIAANEGTELPPIRHRRVTCDVLSFATLWVTVNDAACATRCLTQGRKGGRCQDGVCICR